MQADVSSPDGPLVDQLGIKIVELSAERVVGTMPVAGNTGPGGAMHSGAACVLAETLAWHGSAAHGGPGRSATGIEISATHHRAAADGEVTGIATRVHGGRTLATYEVEITDSGGSRVCTARLTCLLRDGSAANGSAANGSAASTCSAGRAGGAGGKGAGDETVGGPGANNDLTNNRGADDATAISSS